MTEPISIMSRTKNYAQLRNFEKKIARSFEDIELNMVDINWEFSIDLARGVLTLCNDAYDFARRIGAGKKRLKDLEDQREYAEALVDCCTPYNFPPVNEEVLKQTRLRIASGF